MKKGAKINWLNVVLPVVIVVLIIAVVFLWLSHTKLKESHEQLVKEVEKEQRVYFREDQSEAYRVGNTEEYCKGICQERKYDGYDSGRITYEGARFDYECTCYMIVRN